MYPRYIVRCPPQGRAIGQGVGRRLPIAVAQVQARVRSCGICGGQRGTGVGLLLVIRFPLPIIPPTAPHSSSSIICGWYKRPNSGYKRPNRGRRTKWTQVSSHPAPPQQTKLRTSSRLPAGALTAGYEVSHNAVRYSRVAYLPMTHRAT
jgi:hypothetical protein